MSQEDMELFVEHNSDLIVDGWVEAVTNGWDDLVFVWQIEGDDLKHLCVPRSMALEAFVTPEGEQCLPEETQNQIQDPAGEGKAWLIFVAPTWVASMRIECLTFDPSDTLN